MLVPMILFIEWPEVMVIQSKTLKVRTLLTDTNNREFLFLPFFFFFSKLINVSEIYSHGQIHLSDAERKRKMVKGSAGIFFQRVLFQSVLRSVSCQSSEGKMKPFISGV